MFDDRAAFSGFTNRAHEPNRRAAMQILARARAPWDDLETHLAIHPGEIAGCCAGTQDSDGAQARASQASPGNWQRAKGKIELLNN